MAYSAHSEHKDQVSTYQDQLPHVLQRPNGRSCSAVMRTEVRRQTFEGKKKEKTKLVSLLEFFTCVENLHNYTNFINCFH